MKKLISVLIFTVIILNLAGCQGKSDLAIEGEDTYKASSSDTTSINTSSEPEVLWESIRGEGKDNDMKTFSNKTGLYFKSIGVRPSGYTNFVTKNIIIELDGIAAYEFTGPDLLRYKIWDLRFEKENGEYVIAENVRLTETGNLVLYYTGNILKVKDDKGNELN